MKPNVGRGPLDDRERARLAVGCVGALCVERLDAFEKEAGERAEKRAVAGEDSSPRSRFDGAAIAGDVALPLIAAGLTYAGRVAGTPSQEHGDQALVGGAIGLGVGLVTGAVYSYLQRPACPYGSGVICW